MPQIKRDKDGLILRAGTPTYSITSRKKKKIWKVSTLWKASKNLPIARLKRSEFMKCLKQNVWFISGFEDDIPTVENVLKHMRRIERANTKYPILLTDGGCICDGYHRLAKIVLKKRKWVRFRMFKEFPPPDRIEKVLKKK